MLTSLPTREIVLSRLTALVKTVSLGRGPSEAAAETARGQTFPFGSYRMCVHGPGSDIDTLRVVPISKACRSRRFSDVFEGMLRNTGVTEVLMGTPRSPCTGRQVLFLISPAQGIPNAHVPIITLKISGIPIDLLMARLTLSSIPDDLTLQKSTPQFGGRVHLESSRGCLHRLAQ